MTNAQTILTAPGLIVCVGVIYASAMEAYQFLKSIVSRRSFQGDYEDVEQVPW